MITAEQERDKYARMWAVSEYSEYSPGENLVPYFLGHADIKAGNSLIDLGCGTGRAGQWLSEHGLDVFLFDHVNALASFVNRPFIEGNLWNLPHFYFDWFFCADVMEHIPPERLDAVLEGCSRIAERGFFQICTEPDNFGAVIGERLHLSVYPAEWWLLKLETFFHVEHRDVKPNHLLVFVKGHHG